MCCHAASLLWLIANPGPSHVQPWDPPSPWRRSARLFIRRKLSTCERNHTRTLGRETGQMTQSPVPPGGDKEMGKVDGPRVCTHTRQWSGSRSGARWLGAQRSRVAIATRKPATPSSGPMNATASRRAAFGAGRRRSSGTRCSTSRLSSLLALRQNPLRHDRCEYRTPSLIPTSRPWLLFSKPCTLARSRG